MPWQIAPSTIRKLTSSVREPSLKTICPHWLPNIRPISTSRHFPAAQTADDASSERFWINPKKEAPRKIGENATATLNEDQPGNRDVLYARCAQLLERNQDASDSRGGSAFTNKTVSVSGVVQSIRKLKSDVFVHITDGSCLEPIQVIFKPMAAAPLKYGTSLQVIGAWRESPAKGQVYEMKAKELHIFGGADPEKYPLQNTQHSAGFLRKIPHLRMRTPFTSFLTRFRSSCISFVHRYLSETKHNGGIFVQVQPPIITSSDCEGAGEVFTVNSNAPPLASEQSQERGTTSSRQPFFRAPKYLTVSSQLHLEAFAAELRNVWALIPIFRADKSDSPRHLAEFNMLEIEMTYVSSLQLLTGLVEQLIRSLVTSLMATPAYHELLRVACVSHEKTKAEKVAEITKRWHQLLDARWTNASYSYCMKRLREAANADPKLFSCQPEFGLSLRLEHERWVVENIGQNRPIFVTHYPKAIKPFYMAPSSLATDYVRHSTYRPSGCSRDHLEDLETGQDTVACFDLLMPFGVGEIAGGSLREHRLENLIQNMREDGMLKPSAAQPSPNKADELSMPATDTEDDYPFLGPDESLGTLKWYADLRRYGTTPHGGFGIGWDRLIMYLTGAHNLRDVVAFPRTFGRADS